MNILQTQNCPECRSSLVDDMQNGEVICSGCGVVVDDQIADSAVSYTHLTLPTTPYV